MLNQSRARSKRIHIGSEQIHYQRPLCSYQLAVREEEMHNGKCSVSD